MKNAISDPRAGLQPVNAAVLEVTRQGWRWRVQRCVSCGRVHLHGAGSINESPREYLNHRAAFCVRGGYELEDSDPTRTARLIDYVRRGLPWVGVGWALAGRTLHSSVKSGPRR